ncbi:uncharacterized protein I206_100037 [Kwoniella pini CBS 10737]|uniref:Uncharacterized protein n=1 Tax=Kwoniella pini CBS 10737 TaxID=1296096 RepID=A0A1B9HSC8_9TREE|nr:uncharacterized protein I206_07852 [Kwoniella pini CBS 10737]OCF46182.1 hypothetical protein I206_07852 [Kwoniella pini CBS 10737]
MSNTSQHHSTPGDPTTASSINSIATPCDMFSSPDADDDSKYGLNTVEEVRQKLKSLFDEISTVLDDISPSFSQSALDKIQGYVRGHMVAGLEEASSQIARVAAVGSLTKDVLDGVYKGTKDDNVLTRPEIRSKVSAALSDGLKTMSDNDLRKFYYDGLTQDQRDRWLAPNYWSKLKHSDVSIHLHRTPRQPNGSLKISFGPFSDIGSKEPIIIRGVNFTIDSESGNTTVHATEDSSVPSTSTEVDDV